MVNEDIKKYAFIISVDNKYVLPTIALLNSIIKFKMTEYADVIILYHNIDPKCFFTNNFKPICIPQDNIVRHNRYLKLHEFAENYKSLCMLDADMFFLADAKRFFEIAENNFIIGCNDDTAFNRKNIKNENNEIIIENIVFHGILCNVPFFFNYQYTKPLWETFSQLYNKMGIKTCAYDLFNYSLALNPEIVDKLITYPSCCFTGVHQTHLKFQTMFQIDLFQENMTENKGKDIVIKDDFIITSDWMRVYSFHGKFFHPNYINDHIKDMTKFYTNNLGCNGNKLNFFLECDKKIMIKLHKIFSNFIFNGEIPIENSYNYFSEDCKKHIDNLRKYI